MANWFSRMFLGSVVIGSLSGSAAQAADNSYSDVRTDPVEIPADVRKGLSHIRIFKTSSRLIAIPLFPAVGTAAVTIRK